MLWWLIGLLLENIRVEFQCPIVTCSLDMTCRLHQRVRWLTAGVGWKFIYLWKLHTLSLLHAKLQLILLTLNFDYFGRTPSKISGRGRWAEQRTTLKWRQWIANTLTLKKNIMSPHHLRWKSGRGSESKKCCRIGIIPLLTNAFSYKRTFFPLFRKSWSEPYSRSTRMAIKTKFHLFSPFTSEFQ